jgi:hypothetical protein
MTDANALFPGFAAHWIDTQDGRIFARLGGADSSKRKMGENVIAGMAKPGLMRWSTAAIFWPKRTRMRRSRP